MSMTMPVVMTVLMAMIVFMFVMRRHDRIKAFLPLA
jgi:hypothetical protein